VAVGTWMWLEWLRAKREEDLDKTPRVIPEWVFDQRKLKDIWKADAAEEMKRRGLDGYRLNPDTDQLEPINWVRDQDGNIEKIDINFKPIDHVALNLETDQTAKQRLSEKWAEVTSVNTPIEILTIKGHGLKVSDYSSSVVKTVAAVDEIRYQNRRLSVLDRLFDQAKADMYKVNDALRKAETCGNDELVDILKKQHKIAKDNFRRITGARNNAVARKSKAADRILVRGVTSNYRIGAQWGMDTLTIGKEAHFAGKHASKIVRQASLGNLPGQRQVFRQTGAAKLPGDRVAFSDIPRRSPTSSQDNLFSQPDFSRSAQSMSSAAPNSPSAKTSGSKLPVIRNAKGDESLQIPKGYSDRVSGIPKGAGKAIGSYKGKTVVDTDKLSPMGASSPKNPNVIYINSKKIAEIARERGMDPKQLKTLVVEHEYIHHTNKYFGTGLVSPKGEPNIRLVPGEAGLKSIPGEGGQSVTIGTPNDAYIKNLQLIDAKSTYNAERNVLNAMTSKFADGSLRKSGIDVVNWDNYWRNENLKLKNLMDYTVRPLELELERM